MNAVTVSIGPAFLVIGLISLVFGIFIIVDMARRPAWQWAQAGSNKSMWLVLEILTMVLVGVVSIIVGIIYLSVVRPKLVAAERRGGPGWSPTPQWPGQPQPWGGQPWGSSPYPGTPPPAGAPPAYPGQPPPGAPGPWAYPGTGAPSPETPAGQPPSAPPPPRAENPPFGWYADPSGRHEKRYWDGTRWTEHVSDGEDRSTDPVSG